MIALWLNTIGLLANFIGAVLIWRYGLPEQLHRDGLEAITVSQVDERQVAKAQLYDCISRIGMFLLTSGFLVQLAALWMK
ncbi:hypothetical protein [Rhodanobacter thiooxydans]|uniref:hypothetical protein n=1 Tax=Rhodanobacter thiooxydans TaxID=416169 RepID=UPI000260CD1A|nr:hypothetical protein [Rhodanobacter thiooxydans]EIM01027.1 hypothetical protein UUA_05812 [Rhodanobacter thiooxydans LCS2]